MDIVKSFQHLEREESTVSEEQAREPIVQEAGGFALS